MLQCSSYLTPPPNTSPQARRTRSHTRPTLAASKAAQINIPDASLHAQIRDHNPRRGRKRVHPLAHNDAVEQFRHLRNVWQRDYDRGSLLTTPSIHHCDHVLSRVDGVCLTSPLVVRGPAYGRLVCDGDVFFPGHRGTGDRNDRCAKGGVCDEEAVIRDPNRAKLKEDVVDMIDRWLLRLDTVLNRPYHDTARLDRLCARVALCQSDERRRVGLQDDLGRGAWRTIGWCGLFEGKIEVQDVRVHEAVHGVDLEAGYACFGSAAEDACWKVSARSDPSCEGDSAYLY